jgi:hypothetical protein
MREHGLFLCSNGVKLEHPFYNSEKGRKTFDELTEEERTAGGMLCLSTDNKVIVRASIEIPENFGDFMDREEELCNQLSEQETQAQ